MGRAINREPEHRVVRLIAMMRIQGTMILLSLDFRGQLGAFLGGVRFP
jgi:hypothetical protein